MDDRGLVNQHYLDRLVAVGETSGVEATEDIVGGNGIKLVAKGSSIDARVRDRLLQHKLLRPLEMSTRVVGGVASRPIDQLAQTLLHKHALLASICDRHTVESVEQAFLNLKVTASLDSMLSVYAAQGPHKLEHAVGVSLLAAGLWHAIDATKPLSPMILAGLMHDVGELYIDPAILAGNTQLEPAQWKHVAAHPVIAARLLQELPGAGPAVAQAVLHHHERLDGFGYPQGVRGDKAPMSGQVLAMAEMLMGMVESGRSPGGHVAIAVRLIPGEFNRQLLDRVTRATRATARSDAAEGALVPQVPSNLASKAAHQAAQLRQLLALQDALHAKTLTSSAALQELLSHVRERCARIRQALCSTGIELADAEDICSRLSPFDPPMQHEVAIVLREVKWRLRELSRELQLRSDRLPAAEQIVLHGLMDACLEATSGPSGVDAPRTPPVALAAPT